jgi:aryl-alcohol dehydrogenase-like predicted oxidoreductase
MQMEQPEYNLLTREKVEKEFAALYHRHGLGLTTWSPLKFGILSGKYNHSKIPADSRFGNAECNKDPFIKSVREKFESGEEMKEALAASERLEVIAKDLGVSQAALSIAWILKNKNVSSVITGASRPEQIVENVRALQVVEKLTPEVIERIEEAVKTKPTADQVRSGVPDESLGIKLNL